MFNDAANTVDPGLEVEFVQQATAFADWCNASGGIFTSGSRPMRLI